MGRLRLFPRTLFGRNLWLIVALIVVGQLINALAYGQLVARPHLKQSAEATARSLQAVAEGLSLLPEAERAGFVARFNARAGGARPLRAPERLSLMERGFLAELAAQLALAPEALAWRREPGGLLAVRMQAFWLVLPSVQPAHQFARTWLIASGVSGLLALLGAWLIQRRINRPLARLVDAAQAVGAGQRRLLLPTDGPAETAALAHGFNEMAAALARDEEERLLMLAGLSHDLRTPLAKIRLASELLRDSMAAGQSDPALLDTLDRSLHGLDGLLTQFLDYARAAHPAEQEQPAVEVGLREFLAETLALAPGLPQPTLAAGHAVTRRTRPQALRRLVLNLIVNAQTHGAPPIELACGRSEGVVWIEVRDRGPGMAPERVETLKRPFQRGDVARGGKPGSGLGLAIVERIARAEGARLSLLPRDGGGLVARISWP